MMTTDIYYAVPEEKAGYCSNPFVPIYDTCPQDLSGEAESLYYQAMAIEQSGLKADFQENLDDWICDIKCNLLAYYKIGLTAWKLKLMKCWEKRFNTFADFCSLALGRSSASINNYIRAANVVSRLIFLGFSKFPHSMSQCLALYDLQDDILADTWGTILDKYEYSKITKQIIEEELMPIDKRPPQTKQIRIELEQWEQIKELAAQSGMKPEQLVKQLLDSYLVKEETEDLEEDSEEDLEKLCTENIAQKDEHTTQELERYANLSLSSFEVLPSSVGEGQGVRVENDFSYYV